MLQLKSVIARFVPDATVILYGSAARGKRGPDSDYDVLILLETPIAKQTREQMRSAVYEMELEREVVICVMISTRDEWNSPLRSVSPFHKNVESDGVLL
jgi:predicted nucleotidyltransferase